MKNFIIRKKNPLAVYCGSLVQQNHGESLGGHGYVIWNLKTKAFRQLDIDNEYGFYTIDIVRGVLNTDITNIPSKVRLRVRCFESVASEVKSVVAEVKKLTTVVEITYVRVDSEESIGNKSITTDDLNLSDLSSVEYQNKLIKEFLFKKFGEKSITDEEMESVFSINEKYNQSIDRDKIVRNIRWKPKRFEFSNMFSYGEDNVIDFTDMKDVIGVFASNASGKSSILSALSFCIFDKCDRAFKASHVLNAQKMTFRCKFNFEIESVNYFIERVGKSDKKGGVKVDVRFWKEEDGKTVELNGEARRSTNDLIRDYLGTYEDFILTVLSIQNNKVGTFVDMGQTERKDLLSQFMGLNMFDELCSKATDKVRELEVESNFIQKSQSQEDTVEMENRLNSFSEQRERLVSECKSLSEERDTSNLEIISLTEQLVKFDEEVSTDINGLNRRKKSLEQTISDSKNFLVNIEKELLDTKNDISYVESEVGKLRSLDIESKFSDLTVLRKELSSKKHEIDKKKILVDGKLEKIKKLEVHKYDPNCKFCVDNGFVKDALAAKQSLVDDKLDVEKLLSDYASLESKVSSNSSVENDYKYYMTLGQKLSILEKSLSQKNKQMMTCQNSLVVDSNSLKEVELMISRYIKQESSIKSNIEIEKSRDILSRKITMIDKQINEKNQLIASISSKIGLIVVEKEKREKNEILLKSIESDIKSYRYYLEAVSRDGIPFELISKAVPIVEREVNTILSQIVEFGVKIQTDGKNVITHIVYSDKSWPLELSSGLEKFLTSLAIRVALINISNLPRPNFIAIDEGFGCADGDNLAAMNSLFSILKTNFDFMIIISHLDSMKDMVDHTIEIKKENGFSKITV